MVDVNKNFDDEPIKKPEDDTFGVDRLAEAIADCIDGLQKPVGSVIAINGPWGSGKSSVINLVRHHLKERKFCESNIITFNCWLYRGEDALMLGFFKDLYKKLSPISSKIRKALPKLGALMAVAGPLIGESIAPGGGVFAKAPINRLRNLISGDDSVEGLRNTVYKALDGQDQRFLVIIDDLDRLSLDEVLLIFRLIKSVGRLPQITYLISYDREIVEKAITERHKAEGGKHYLEKMVQAGFEIPEPDLERLNDMVWGRINEIFEDAVQSDDIRLTEIIDKAIMSELRTPRDVVRFANTISITWGAVRGKVNIADFICIEMLRLFRPDIHRAVGGIKFAIMGAPVFNKNPAEYYDTLLLSSVPEVPKEPKESENPENPEKPNNARTQWRDILIFLFPQLGLVWEGGTDFDTEHWLYERRVCDSDHFDTYFRFSPPDMLVSSEKIDEIIRRSGDSGFVEATFREALSPTQREGHSKVLYLLKALISYEGDFPKESVSPFINTMFRMADELWEEYHESEGFLHTPNRNSDRLLQLTKILTLSRFDLEERSRLISDACESASPSWLVYFVSMYERERDRRAGGFSQSSDKNFMTEEHMGEVKGLALRKIHAARDNGTLIKLPVLLFVLFEWGRMDEGEYDSVKSWIDQILKQDEDVGRLAKAFLGRGAGTVNSPDRLGGSGVERRDSAQLHGITEIMKNPDQFNRRLEEVRDGGNVSEEGRENIERLLKAWDESD